MKRFSEQFYKKSESVKLEAAERDTLRQRVVSYMEYHPLPASMKQASAKVIQGPLTGDQYRSVRIPLAMLLKWSAAVSALVLIVVPVLAEEAIPGDTLYAVKVRFNEEIRSTLTLSPYERVEWETERLNRRLSEARLLANEGRLTSEVEAEVVAAVREHTENVQEGIEVLREEDADQATLASIELNTTLALQSSSLQGDTTVLAMTVTEEDENSTQLIADVLNETLSKREGVIASSTIPAYEKIVARVETNTTRAYELLHSLNLPQDDRLRVGIDRRLADVNRSIEKANSLRGSSDESARQHLLGALQRTQKLILYLNDTEVGRGMDIESIVPVIPTPEEEQKYIEATTQEINRKVQILTEVKNKLSSDVLQKVEFTLTTVTEKQTGIELASDFNQKKILSEESIALLNDTFLLVEADGVTPVETVEPTDPLDTETASTSDRTPRAGR